MTLHTIYRAPGPTQLTHAPTRGHTRPSVLVKEPALVDDARVRQIYESLRGVSADALDTPAFTAALTEYGRTRFPAEQLPDVIAALRYLAAHDSAQVPARAHLRRAVGRLHALSKSATLDEAQRRAHATAAINLNFADPRNWGGAANLPDNQVRDLIVASINHRLARIDDAAVAILITTTRDELAAPLHDYQAARQ